MNYAFAHDVGDLAKFVVASSWGTQPTPLEADLRDELPGVGGSGGPSAS